MSCSKRHPCSKPEAPAPMTVSTAEPIVDPSGDASCPVMLISGDLVDYIFKMIRATEWLKLSRVCRTFHRAAQRVCENLTVVDLVDSPVFDKDLIPLLRRVRGAQHLHLDCWHLSDKPFEDLPDGLVCLELREVANLTSKAFAQVASRCTRLESLNVCSSHRSVSPLHCPFQTSYRKLGIRQVLEGCTQLKELALDVPDGECDAAVDVAALCKSLTDLHLHVGRSRQALRLPLAAMSALPLEALSVSACDLKDANGEHFASTVASLFPKLEEMYIDLGFYLDVTEDPRCLLPLATLSKLRRFHVAPIDDQLGDANGLIREVVTNCMLIEELYVDFPVKDELVEHVAQTLTSTLTSLHFAESKELTGRALDALTQHCTALTNLTLFSNEKGNTNVPTESWEAFAVARSTNLHRIVVRNVSAAAVGAIIEHCVNLDHLSMRDCHITDEMLVAVAKKCRKLGFLDIAESKYVTNRGIEQFARTCNGRQLHTLSLNQLKQVNDSGVAALAAAVTDEWSVEVLNLNSGGSLTEAALQAIVQSQLGKTLYDLDVNGMKLTEACIPILSNFDKLRRIWGLQNHKWLGLEIGRLSRVCPRLIVEHGNEDES